MPMAIVVHGGAGTISPDRIEITRAGCEEAAQIGLSVLQKGGSALDAVEAAVRALEDNPNYNAGTGSSLTKEGNIEMDAGLMDGDTLRVGAVAAVERIKNPILLARKVMESPHVLLAGRGAQQFALEQGFTFCTRDDLLTERQYNNWLKAREQENGPDGQEDEPRFYRYEVGFVPAREEPERQQQTEDEAEDKHGTVGAVALDQSGALAAATSTGGIHNKYPGRIGDSPLVGCGFYADENAAVSCTGHGEDFVRLLIARRAAEYVARGLTAHKAAEEAIGFLGAKASGTGGLIIVDHRGNVGFAWNSQNMAYAYRRAEQ
jgi:beta-aspartyl-peptidase (threonine type)